MKTGMKSVVSGVVGIEPPSISLLTLTLRASPSSIMNPKYVSWLPEKILQQPRTLIMPRLAFRLNLQILLLKHSASPGDHINILPLSPLLNRMYLLILRQILHIQFLTLLSPQRLTSQDNDMTCVLQHQSIQHQAAHPPISIPKRMNEGKFVVISRRKLIRLALGPLFRAVLVQHIDKFFHIRRHGVGSMQSVFFGFPPPFRSYFTAASWVLYLPAPISSFSLAERLPVLSWLQRMRWVWRISSSDQRSFRRMMWLTR